MLDFTGNRLIWSMDVQWFPAEGRRDHARQLDLLSMWLRSMMDTDRRDLCIRLTMVKSSCMH